MCAKTSERKRRAACSAVWLRLRQFPVQTLYHQGERNWVRQLRLSALGAGDLDDGNSIVGALVKVSEVGSGSDRDKRPQSSVGYCEQKELSTGAL